ncbi:GNAT family N-acetyltransferase [Amycolatopsis suaedae]|uniref:GNAT family N-acetyltransferase n=1 Tax=Amycolatopsis suaedae TaxID=2510978 RepID=A0A4Q7JCM8_9PSEU|nr:GNAT family N-acetyltransferase [Amycolatopsis suaedae]RZQ64313.1 GNAT family N-acetyltransferase [Amycolatopsis suaedae]
MTDVVFRPLRADEMSVFSRHDDPALVGFGAFGRSFGELWRRGEYRPEWTWVAQRGDEVLARAAWWGGPDDPEPAALDWFDFGDRPDLGAGLLREAPWRVEYQLALPPDWRERPDVRAARDARVEAAERAGMRLLVERLRYHWTAGDGLPARPGRLVYRPEPDDEVFLDVLRRINVGTLDAHALLVISKGGIDLAAREDLEFLRWMPSPRDWWRLACTPDGEVAGLTVPGRNYAGPVVGLIGVVPEQRGHGYAYDLLVECTHLLVEAGCTEVIAATDCGNAPMAAAFARANYPVTEERAVLHWP